MSYLENALDLLTQGPNSIIFQQIYFDFWISNSFSFLGKVTIALGPLRQRAFRRSLRAKINKQSFIATDVTGLDSLKTARTSGAWTCVGGMCQDGIRFSGWSQAGQATSVWMLKLLPSQRSPAGNSLPHTSRLFWCYIASASFEAPFNGQIAQIQAT